MTGTSQHGAHRGESFATQFETLSGMTRWLFSGEISTEYAEKTQASREFFRRIAAQAGQEANFTENPGKMLAYLLTAIVPDR